MTVYVDKAIWSLGRMKMCHMISDSEDELHSMADKIGVARKHYQVNSRYRHYDVCKSKRELAVKFGAKEISSKELVKIARSNLI